MTDPVPNWRDRLVARYPAIFDASPSYRSGYPEVEDGWRGLIETAVDRLAEILRDRPGTSLIIDQIKEKFGTLRVYSHGSYLSDTETRARADLVVRLAEARSACTCEICGSEGRLYKSRGWFATACEEHGRGAPVPIRPGFENLSVIRQVRDGKLRIVTCRRYSRDDDAFVDVDPASVGLGE